MDGLTGADVSFSETVSDYDFDEHFLKALPLKDRVAREELGVEKVLQSGFIGDFVRSAVLTSEV